MTNNTLRLRIYSSFNIIYYFEVAPDTNQGYIIMKFILISLLMLFGIATYAQNTILHVVQRGETLETIASKYGVTVDDLKQFNEGTDQFFYAGMKLTIPKKSTPVHNSINSDGRKEEYVTAADSSAAGKLMQYNYENDRSANRHEDKLAKYKIYFNYQFNRDNSTDKKNGVTTTTRMNHSTYEINIVRQFWLNDLFSFNAGLGYNNTKIETDFTSVAGNLHDNWKENNTRKVTSNSLIIPIELQADLGLLLFHVGLRNQIAMSGYMESDSEKEKFKFNSFSDRYFSSAYVGGDIRLGNLIMGADYNFSVSNSDLFDDTKGSWSFRIGMIF